MPDPDIPHTTPYAQHESLGKLYVNRFAIDEEDQFEILGVYPLAPEDIDCLTKPDINNEIMKAIQIHRSGGTFSYQLHILWASCTGFHEDIHSLFDLFIKCHGSLVYNNAMDYSCTSIIAHGVKSAMVSILEMTKYDCITKVGFDQFAVLVTETLHFLSNRS